MIKFGMTTEAIFEKDNQIFELGSLEESDIDTLIEMAKQWVRNRDTGVIEEGEIEEIRERMNCSLHNQDYRYYVIRDEFHTAIGCCAIRAPEGKMEQYKSSPTANSTELVNVFLDNKYRGKGLGFRLMNYLFEKASLLGFDEVIWNSGPRYKESAWDFYNQLVGEPIDIAHQYYGEDGDAPVWRKKVR